MAIVKLVCQGCGANLDALDESRVLQCGYCGTNNQIKQTYHPTTPTPAPPHYAPPPQYQQPPQPVISTPRPNAGAGSGAARFVVIMAIIPLVIGVLASVFLLRSGVSTFEQLSQQLGGALNNMRKFYWSSGHPMIIDVDGDQTDDVIGTLQEIGEQKLMLSAISGSSYATLWEVELGRLTDLPDVKLYLEPGAKLVLVAMGPALHAHDVTNGTTRWVASLPDKIETVALDGDHLWIATIDQATSSVTLIDGKVTPTSSTPSAAAKPLRDDGGYDLIPDLGQLDLQYDQFEGLRVSQAFCPIEDLPIIVGRRHDDDDKRCSNPNGLAFVTRDKGTGVPFMIGYARDSKAERWRVQLTKPGSLETVDTGFGQPRAEFFGDEAIISLVPSVDSNARIRRISLTDGSIAWETTLVRKNIENIDGIGIGNNLVFVNYGQSLRVLSLADGTELASLGGY
jgi:DNA-directed RNA polymerase subunit RPC12/RpoP